ncbi:hypothetical protein [Homoserinibacter sp. GY 40078]|uniref:hypothetical protein n=1 Tax=Homoserinibacter sp. GY 40078 TaxID=2603275 RepID=UPI0011C7D481|nr:hypothetical protein [Homoserinibacter sp. GY 40078]TXK17386.1 hypothetical protein FVQ89_11165 [Homoserinibacter sp. GY 40078]
MSALFADAARNWRKLRSEFEDYREQAYERAAEACRDHLLNRRGRAAHVDPYSLFMGPWARVQAYASEELLEWFAEHGRMTFEEFERQRIDALHYEEMAG